MKNILMALALVACGAAEEDMSRVAPRAIGPVIPSKNQARILADKTAAVQNTLYQAQDFVRPVTLDPALANSVVTANLGTEGYWVITRLKGVVRKATFQAVEFHASNLGVSDAVFAVAVCRYEETYDGVAVKEMARAKTVVPSASSGSTPIQVTLSSPVTLSPSETYAVAVFIDAPGAGASFYCSSGEASQPLIWGSSAGTVGGHAVDETVEFDSAGNPDVLIRVPATSPNTTAVPYVAIVRGWTLDRWY